MPRHFGWWLWVWRPVVIMPFPEAATYSVPPGQTSALGMLQQIFELLQDLVGLRVRYPTVLLDMGDAPFNRLVQQFACLGGEVLAIHIIRVPRYPQKLRLCPHTGRFRES